MFPLSAIFSAKANELSSMDIAEVVAVEVVVEASEESVVEKVIAAAFGDRDVSCFSNAFLGMKRVDLSLLLFKKSH